MQPSSWLEVVLRTTGHCGQGVDGLCPTGGWGMGFLKPEQPNFADNVFLAGDAATGASLVVRAMAGGRKTAAEIDTYLTTKN